MTTAQNIFNLIDDILKDLNNPPLPPIKQTTPNKKRNKRDSKIQNSNLPLPTLQNGNTKSTLLQPMQSKYDSAQVEALWDAWWEKRGYYSPETDTPKQQFTIMLAPPNVTGSLHLGHALMSTIQDTITRYWRMKGKNCLWLPGTDHAGIATQSVVERRLQRKGLTRHDLGREKFLDEVWKWTKLKGGKICSQLREMGCSLDWSRKVFTMDTRYQESVTEAFVRLYNNELIYRDNRLCNWSCHLQSAISNEEVDKIEITEKDIRKGKAMINVPGYNRKIRFGVMHRFAYPLIKLNECDNYEEIIVATTRIETMLGDTAIAVHPKDDKYNHLIGRYVQHPFIKDRIIKIIGDDELVKISKKDDEKKNIEEIQQKINKKKLRNKQNNYKHKQFKGTGAVKITPSHDENDFKCGKKNNLEFINILSDDGMINENGGEFIGMKRYDARDKIIERLKEMGLFRSECDNPMVLNMCSRSKDIIEPIQKPQWYMNCDDLASKAFDAVFKNKTLKILPKKKENEIKYDEENDNVFRKTLSQHEQQWYDYLHPKHMRRWCISRQLWWGHRIPAYKLIFDENEIPNNWDIDDWKLNWIIARSFKDANKIAINRLCIICGEKANSIQYKLSQDEDVLDTWFSSGLFPFASLGWPNNTNDLNSFFPGDLLETGGDIIFFWVARMVMMSYALTNKLPFHTVYIHPMVRDEYGKKMSKQKGNVLDPLHIINGVKLNTLIEELYDGNLRDDLIDDFEKKKRKKFANGIKPCGSDSLRFGLLSLLVQRSINLNIRTVIGKRLFCNKIWQAAKLVLSYFDDKYSDDEEEKKQCEINYEFMNLFLGRNSEASLADKWILSRLNQCLIECEENNQKYEFGVSANVIYQFFYHEFCDYYLELIKHTMRSEGNNKRKIIIKNILYIVLRESLKIMHPFMPFITEELYQRIEKAKYGKQYKIGDRSIMMENYPDKAIKSWDNEDIENDMHLIQNICIEIRSQKQGCFAHNKYAIFLSLKNGIINENKLKIFCDYINVLTKCKSVTILMNNNTQKLDLNYIKYNTKISDKNNNEILIKIYHDAMDIVSPEIPKMKNLINENQRLLEKTNNKNERKKIEQRLKEYCKLLTFYQNLIN